MLVGSPLDDLSIQKAGSRQLTVHALILKRTQVTFPFTPGTRTFGACRCDNLAGLVCNCTDGEREWRNWQTRTVQVRVPERAWGFKSPLAHHVLSQDIGKLRTPRVRSFPCFVDGGPRSGRGSMPINADRGMDRAAHSGGRRRGNVAQNRANRETSSSQGMISMSVRRVLRARSRHR
jgi:hypothetical protein